MPVMMSLVSTSTSSLMASFLGDICQLSGRRPKYFEERHEKVILDRLRDRSASLKVWEDAVHCFLRHEGIQVRFRDRPCRE